MALFAALMVVVVSSASAQSSTSRSEDELTSDLRTVIILAGYPCKTIVDFSQSNASVYHVLCDLDRRYRVRISEEEKIHVENLSGPPSTPSTPDDEHGRDMKRHLFAIVNLAGHSCDEVLDYERRGPSDSLVTCHDLTIYRIHVTPEGRVAVEKHPVEK